MPDAAWSEARGAEVGHAGEGGGVALDGEDLLSAVLCCFHVCPVQCRVVDDDGDVVAGEPDGELDAGGDELVEIVGLVRRR